MKIVIDVDESDYKELCQTVMSIDEMENTTQGRVYGAIVRGDMIKLPSVESERKTGKWHLLDECANDGWYCDQCHKKVFKVDFSNTMRKYKFCPNCGAKMEVKE